MLLKIKLVVLYLMTKQSRDSDAVGLTQTLEFKKPGMIKHNGYYHMPIEKFISGILMSWYQIFCWLLLSRLFN